MNHHFTPPPVVATRFAQHKIKIPQGKNPDGTVKVCPSLHGVSTQPYQLA